MAPFAAHTCLTFLLEVAWGQTFCSSLLVYGLPSMPLTLVAWVVFCYIDDFGGLFVEDDAARSCPKAREWLEKMKKEMQRLGFSPHKDVVTPGLVKALGVEITDPELWAQV